jgi:cytochrome c heme-lyase
MLQDLIDQIFLKRRGDSSSSPISDAMSSDKDAAACPVDHKSREAWLAQAKSATSSTATTSQALPPSHPSVPKGSAEESCPVDHQSREAWLEQARRNAPQTAATAAPAHPGKRPGANSATASSSWSESLWSWVPFTSTYSTQSPTTTTSPGAHGSLDTAREVSTIPRASSSPSDPPTATSENKRPANSEQESGADAASGNWIYPSERMFFDAMKRKGHDPKSNDMRTIVPIHNAVNERAWAEIKKWEEPWIQGTT